jgi:hypothetical protein
MNEEVGHKQILRRTKRTSILDRGRYLNNGKSNWFNEMKGL